MWIICGTASVILCISGWILSAKKNPKAVWASVCSLGFVSITLLMEYRMVLEWVNKEDWAALLDVVPYMFYVLAGYAIIMLAANVAAMVVIRKKAKLSD